MKAFNVNIFLLIAGLLSLNLYSCQRSVKSGNNNSMDTIPKTFTTAAEAAKSGIDVLKALVSNKNLSSSFSLTEAEVNELTVGNGLVVQEVSFTKLITLNADSGSISGALMASNGMIYPLEIKGRVRSTALVSVAGDKWKLTDAGQSGNMTLFELQNQLPPSEGTSIIHIPSLSLNCITAKGANGILYIPDNSLPGTRIIKGEPMGEKEFSKEIISYAKQFYDKNKKAIDDKKILD